MFFSSLLRIQWSCADSIFPLLYMGENHLLLCNLLAWRKLLIVKTLSVWVLLGLGSVWTVQSWSKLLHGTSTQLFHPEEDLHRCGFKWLHKGFVVLIIYWHRCEIQNVFITDNAVQKLKSCIRNMQILSSIRITVMGDSQIIY